MLRRAGVMAKIARAGRSGVDSVVKSRRVSALVFGTGVALASTSVVPLFSPAYCHSEPAIPGAGEASTAADAPAAPKPAEVPPAAPKPAEKPAEKPDTTPPAKPEEKKKEVAAHTKVINADQEMLKRRTLFLVGHIEDGLATLLVQRMLWLEAEDPGTPITLIINSPGGEVSSGLAIMDAMRGISSPVRTICIGRAYSMAAVLLAAGAEGHRTCSPNARVMVHQISMGYGRASATDVLIRAAQMQQTKDQMNRILSHLTKQPLDLVTEVCERDHYLTATQAQKFGIVDKISETMPVSGLSPSL
mmetsp:Transcript_32771/g.74710  ORF Transcript_32771/g.74710 Transcript_32771/m.74710 type:complete len:303 (-) Transcript_32771:129-1037(-)